MIAWDPKSLAASTASETTSPAASTAFAAPSNASIVLVCAVIWLSNALDKESKIVSNLLKAAFNSLMLLSPEIEFQTLSNDEAVDEAFSAALFADLNFDSIAFWSDCTLAVLNLNLAPLFVFDTSLI